MNKKLLLALTLMASVALPSVAQSFTEGYLNYEVIDPDLKTVKIVSFDYSLPAEELVIPASVTYESESYTVTTIAEWALCFAPMTSVTLPEGFTTLGDGALCYNDNLESVKLPSTLESIPYACFRNNPALKTIDIPASATLIGENAFDECTALKTVVTGNGVETIGNQAFHGCTALQSLRLGSSIEEMGDQVFSGCTALTSVELPSSLTVLGEGVFQECTALTEIKVKSGNIIYASQDGVLYDKDFVTLIAYPAALSGIYLPSTVETIGSYAFSAYQSATAPYLPESIITVGDHAFNNSLIESIALPASVQEIGNGVFARCAQLTTVSFGNLDYGCNLQNIGNVLFSNNTALDDVYIYRSEPPTVPSQGYFVMLDGIVNLWVPVGSSETYQNASGWRLFTVKDDPNQPMYVNSGLFQYEIHDLTVPEMVLRAPIAPLPSELVIPETVEFDGTNYTVVAIGDLAFCQSSEVNSIEIPASIKKIGDASFAEASIQSVKFNEGLEEIGLSCFAYSPIREIELPKSVNKMGYMVFVDCDELTKANLDCAIEKVEDSLFYGCDKLKEVTLGNNLTEIRLAAFYECVALEEIAIPEGVETIDMSVFYGCSSLRKVSLPASLETLEGTALANTPALETIELNPDNLFFKSVDGILFSYDQTTLVRYPSARVTENMEYTIPEGTEKVGLHAFSYSPAITKITLPSTVTEIEGFGFYQCEGLTDISLNEGLIGLWDSVFQNCTSLTEVTLPDSLQGIQYWLFSGCTSLKKLFFGSNVQLIGPYMLQDVQLEELHISTVNPPVTYPFYYVGDNIIFDVIVPDESVDAYKSMSPWSQMNIIGESEYSGVRDINASQAEELFTVYGIDGTQILVKASADQLRNLPAGLYIVNGKKRIVH